MSAGCLPLHSFELVDALESEACDARAHHESWEDMVSLQEAGIYPAAFLRGVEPQVVDLARRMAEAVASRVTVGL